MSTRSDSGPADSGGGDPEACVVVDGPISEGTWWGDGAPVLLKAHSDGTGTFVYCASKAEVASTNAVNGVVDWEVSWFDTTPGDSDSWSGSPVGETTFTGVACVDRISGRFGEGRSVVFTLQNESGCCGCE